MKNFDDIWLLLSPKAEYGNRKRACYELWSSLSPEVQQAVYETIADKKTKGLFVDYNPYYAILKNSSPSLQTEKVRWTFESSGGRGLGFQQTLSFKEYYARYGTTEEKDGWRRVFLPEKQTTIYLKS